MAFQIEITEREALYLSDALSMHSQGPKEGVRPYPHLLMKIGAVILETARSGATFVNISLDEDELWMVREAAKHGVQVGQEKVGLNLIRKVYMGLQQLTAEDATHEAVAQVGDGVVDEPTTDEKRQAIDEWKGKEEQRA